MACMARTAALAGTPLKRGGAALGRRARTAQLRRRRRLCARGGSWLWECAWVLHGGWVVAGVASSAVENGGGGGGRG